jgi:hypothetical protein
LMKIQTTINLLGLIPTKLLKEAGIIIEPSVSVPKEPKARPSLYSIRSVP